MMKKTMIVLTTMVFACSSSLLMTSCAKKHVGMSEGTAVTSPEKAGEKRAGEDESYKKREAERQAKLRAMEREQRLRNEIRVFESESIYFEFDKSELKPASRASLKKKADWLRANPLFSVRIEGHCDERGTNEYNLALGERRANSAWKFLNALGISGSRISIISYGEEKPADPGHNQEAWAKNRRDDFKLIK